jgi:hypothetical protein
MKCRSPRKASNTYHRAAQLCGPRMHATRMHSPSEAFWCQQRPWTTPRRPCWRRRGVFHLTVRILAESVKTRLSHAQRTSQTRLSRSYLPLCNIVVCMRTATQPRVFAKHRPLCAKVPRGGLLAMSLCSDRTQHVLQINVRGRDCLRKTQTDHAPAARMYRALIARQNSASQGGRKPTWRPPCSESPSTMLAQMAA